MTRTLAASLADVDLTETARRRLWWIRLWVWVEVAGLVVSGMTAFPLAAELRVLADVAQKVPLAGELGLTGWVVTVANGLDASYAQFPWLGYGTDWLAFAHLVIALAFVGALLDPIRNIWVIEWGMWACVGIIPLALIAGSVRQLPWGWMLIDMSFGVFGIIPLLLARYLTVRLARE